MEKNKKKGKILKIKQRNDKIESQILTATPESVNY
jgi:uncharacterized protein (DUF2344 family)